jgi:hypothetical protein
MSVRPSLPSVCPHGTTGIQLDGLSLNVMLEYFSKKKTVDKMKVSLKLAKNNG